MKREIKIHFSQPRPREQKRPEEVTLYGKDAGLHTYPEAFRQLQHLSRFGRLPFELHQ